VAGYISRWLPISAFDSCWHDWFGLMLLSVYILYGKVPFVLQRHKPKQMFTSPAEAVVKYCNEHVCVCVCLCLSAGISPEPHARFLPNFLFMLPIAVAWSSSGKVAQS